MNIKRRCEKKNNRKKISQTLNEFTPLSMKLTSKFRGRQSGEGHILYIVHSCSQNGGNFQRQQKYL